MATTAWKIVLLKLAEVRCLVNRNSHIPWSTRKVPDPEV